MRVREGRSEDVPRLLEIYNHYVEHTPITFDVEPLSLESRRAWFDAFDVRGPHRIYVGETNGRVGGYACSGRFRPKAAYDRSIEMSIYLDPDDCGGGLGTRLYSTLLDALESEPTTHRALAGITLPNDASLALHRRFGFERVATFSDVGFKFGRYWDVAWLERPL
jgi:phosphinothricin acetyltransferase